MQSMQEKLEKRSLIFHADVSPDDYAFYGKHKEAFKTMWSEHTKGDRVIFVQEFFKYAESHGCIADMPRSSTTMMFVHDVKKQLIHAYGLHKCSTACTLMQDIAILTLHRGEAYQLSSRGPQRGDPFYAKESRETFRKMFGEPNEQDTYKKMIVSYPLYMRFGGAVSRYLRFWLENNRSLPFISMIMHVDEEDEQDIEVRVTCEDNQEFLKRLKKQIDEQNGVPDQDSFLSKDSYNASEASSLAKDKGNEEKKSNDTEDKRKSTSNPGKLRNDVHNDFSSNNDEITFTTEITFNDQSLTFINLSGIHMNDIKFEETNVGTEKSENSNSQENNMNGHDGFKILDGKVEIKFSATDNDDESSVTCEMTNEKSVDNKSKDKREMVADKLIRLINEAEISPNESHSDVTKESMEEEKSGECEYLKNTAKMVGETTEKLEHDETDVLQQLDDSNHGISEFLKPGVATLDHKRHYCAHCGTQEDVYREYKKCALCKGRGTKFYCGRVCQEKHWIAKHWKDHND